MQKETKNKLEDYFGDVVVASYDLHVFVCGIPIHIQNINTVQLASKLKSMYIGVFEAFDLSLDALI